MSFLEVRDLVVAYGAIQAVRGVTFDVEQGQIVSLIGSNGAGKTTTLRTISGLLRPVSGEVLLDGEPIHRMPAHEILRRGVAHSPEGRRLFARMTVEENLRLGLAGRKRNGSSRLMEAYELFPVLRDFRRRAAGVLSGGQQQQLAIARALVAEPELLLLDEPSLGLAPLAVDAVFETLASIRERGVTILLVEQRAIHTVALCDRTHVLVGGELKMTLEPKDAADKAKIVAAYLSA